MSEHLFHMPAEWEAHRGTLIAWPHNKDDWPDKFSPIPFVFADIIRWISYGERVRLLVKNEKQRDQALDICERSGVVMDQLDVHIVPTNRVWMRDSGPIIVKDAQGSRHALNWRFNAWAKYSNHKLDNAVPKMLEEPMGITLQRVMHKGKHVVLEGGSIDVNGAGILITTEECLLSDVQYRNPGYTREDYEAIFSKYLGIKNIIWLGKGIVGDDTHGHVDDITRFVSEDSVVTVVENDADDANHELLKDNLDRLRAARDINGKQLNIATLPMPKPVFFEGQRLPASYANFYISNTAVLVPTFNDPADRTALQILAEFFPTREVVGIHALDLVWGLGTIHCLSQQEPA